MDEIDENLRFNRYIDGIFNCLVIKSAKGTGYGKYYCIVTDVCPDVYGSGYLHCIYEDGSEENVCKDLIMDGYVMSKEERESFCRKLSSIHYEMSDDIMYRIKVAYGICHIIKPFDKVLVRSNECMFWHIDFYSYRCKDGLYVCSGGVYDECVPYCNDTCDLNGSDKECSIKYNYYVNDVK